MLEVTVTPTQMQDIIEYQKNAISTGNIVPGFSGFFTIFSSIAFFIIIAFFILYIWSIVDVIKNNESKVMWLILLVLGGPIVSLIYLLMRPKKVNIVQQTSESVIKNIEYPTKITF